jgi:UDP-N-acetylmuramoylalanine--D-glutamate ligase
MADYQGKKVVIIGLGLTGLSCVDFFMARGVTPRVMDTRISPPGLDKLPESVERHLGDLNQDWLLAADLIVASPGMALATPALSAAAEAGVEIVGDIELFCREAQAPIVAITGSNGKSTVTTLVGEMAKAAGWAVGVGGNIGLPALSLLRQECQLYVLELSSFQLETTYSLHAAAATILNVTEDHMDRYPFGLQQYRAAKLKVYENASLCVVNADDALTMPIRGGGSALHQLWRRCGRLSPEPPTGRDLVARARRENPEHPRNEADWPPITTPMRWRRWHWPMR